MRLTDAIALCDWSQAKLIIRDQDDPLAWGRCTPDGFGTLYMWTLGHTVPLMQCQYSDDMPAEDDRELCVCGKDHGFPSMRNEDDSFDLEGWERWARLQADDRWEPVNPITILDAIVKASEDQEP